MRVMTTIISGLKGGFGSISVIKYGFYPFICWIALYDPIVSRFLVWASCIKYCWMCLYLIGYTMLNTLKTIMLVQGGTVREP